ncbi:hypothetical protein WA026_017648 [Henosepilachna vigintioctopunctata]|uniref:Uncharacterized protein n=1 Tax=Henosepilachna vigintioctopunctata TaxID=420089 RepID=A0AAW1U8L8_9CUCU
MNKVARMLRLKMGMDNTLNGNPLNSTKTSREAGSSTAELQASDAKKQNGYAFCTNSPESGRRTPLLERKSEEFCKLSFADHDWVWNALRLPQSKDCLLRQFLYLMYEKSQHRRQHR